MIEDLPNELLDINQVPTRSECINLNTLYRYMSSTDYDPVAPRKYYTYVYRYLDKGEEFVLNFQETEKGYFDVSRSTEKYGFANMGGISFFKYANNLSKILKTIVHESKKDAKQFDYNEISFGFIHLGYVYTSKHLDIVINYLEAKMPDFDFSGISERTVFDFFYSLVKGDLNLPDKVKEVMREANIGEYKTLAREVEGKIMRFNFLKRVFERIFKKDKSVRVEPLYSTMKDANGKEIKVPQSTTITFSL